MNTTTAPCEERTYMGPASFNSLISAACGGCQQLRTLKLHWNQTGPETISAIRPLLPRLSCFHLIGYLCKEIPLAAFEEALASMTSLTELHLDCPIKGFDRARPGSKEIPGRLIASLPKGLARLSIRNVSFEDSGFGSFQCSETLTDLEIGVIGQYSADEGPMGLSAAVNLKRLSVVCREHCLPREGFGGHSDPEQA